MTKANSKHNIYALLSDKDKKILQIILHFMAGWCSKNLHDQFDISLSDSNRIEGPHDWL